MLKVYSLVWALVILRSSLCLRQSCEHRTGRHEYYTRGNLDFQHGTVPELKPCQALYILDTSTISSDKGNTDRMCIFQCVFKTKFPAVDPALQALPVSQRGLATLGYSSLIHRVLCGINSTQNANANPLH